MEVVWCHDMRGLHGKVNSLWRNINGSGTASGPFGETDCLSWGQNDGNYLDAFPAGSGINEGGMSFWAKTSRCNHSGNRFMSFEGADGTVHFYLKNDGSNEIQVYNNSHTSYGGTAIAYSSDWNHWEVRWKIHDTEGYIVVRQNGVERYRVTNVDTKGNVTSTEVGTVFVSSGWCIGSWYRLAHVAFCTTTGISDDYMGETVVEELLVTGAGSNSDFTTTGSATNWQNVDEKPFDETTYNSSQTTGAKDDYAVADPDFVGDILAIGHIVVAKQDTAGSTQLKVGILTEGAAVAQSTFDINSDRFRQYIFMSSVNPDDSQPYEITDIDGMQVRVEIA